MIEESRNGRRIRFGINLMHRTVVRKWPSRTYEATKRVSKNTLKTRVDMVVVQMSVFTMKFSQIVETGVGSNHDVGF